MQVNLSERAMYFIQGRPIAEVGLKGPDGKPITDEYLASLDDGKLTSILYGFAVGMGPIDFVQPGDEIPTVETKII